MDERGGRLQHQEYLTYCRSIFARGSGWCGRAALTGDRDVTKMADGWRRQLVARTAAALGISDIFPGEADTTLGGGPMTDDGDDGRMTDDSDDGRVTDEGNR